MSNIGDQKKKLANGLYLVMFFKSIHAAGDRFQVVFEAVVDVEIKESYFNGDVLSDLNPENVRQMLGNKTSFHYSKTRNFVAEDEKDSILEDMKEQFLKNSFNYLSSPRFPLKLIKRNYIKAEKEEMIRINREKYLA
jgi:hypothetical protein